MSVAFQPLADLTVAVVTYNSADCIQPLVASIKRLLPSAGIVVVDNGSSDQTCEIVEQIDGVDLIEGHGNIGFGAGANVAISAAPTRLVLLLNPDTQLQRVDARALNEMLSRRSVGLIACQVTDDGVSSHMTLETVWGWRRELTWLVALCFLIPREMRSVQRPTWRSRKSRTWVSGEALILDRDEFLGLGGFDASLFLYFEDNELSQRYADAGLPITTTNAVTVQHDGQGSWPTSPERVQAWAFMSLIEMVAVRRGAAEAKRAARITLDTLTLITWVGAVAGRLPVVGTRATKKRNSAATVRRTILETAASPPTASAYRRSRSELVARAR